MKRVSTNIKDCNGREIFSTDVLKYTYYRCGKVSYTSTGNIEWGEEDGVEGWLIGGALLSSIGKFDTKKDKETIEVVSSED